MGIVRNSDHSDGAPTVGATGIRVKDLASASEQGGEGPDEITQLYPDRTLGDILPALNSSCRIKSCPH